MDNMLLCLAISVVNLCAFTCIIPDTDEWPHCRGPQDLLHSTVEYQCLAPLQAMLLTGIAIRHLLTPERQCRMVSEQVSEYKSCSICMHSYE